ncbi:hypothetical protein PA10_00140 [Pseudomonas phage pPa_SNUABM_DT01]|nr:hypothetical protein PA10_00140 [Pseudomonas phage pPa_SNUABM_DT01]
MIIINTSEVIADLIPEVCHHLDPDAPFYDELPLDVRKYFKALILKAFNAAKQEDLYCNVNWLLRIQCDRSFIAVADRRWVDVEVVDSDGTFVLLIEER